MSDVKRFIEECRRFLPLFSSVEWMVTEEQTDDGHVSDFQTVLGETRTFDDQMPDMTGMHYIRSSTTGRTLAIIGNSTDSPERARMVVGVLSSMPAVFDELERLDARVIELLESNNEKLMEVRSLRQKVRELESRWETLLKLMGTPV